MRSRLPDLVHQEIWAYLIVHHAISALTARASAAADLDPDRISFTPSQDWTDALPKHRTDIARLLISKRRERTCPRAVKRARHNSYRIKKTSEPASVRHDSPATVRIHATNPRAA